LQREARKILGYFVWKITILRQKIIFFPILGGRAPGAPPLDPPLKMATSFSGGRSRSTRREPPTMGKQLINFITCGCESSAPVFVIYKAGREPTPYWWKACMSC
jgi:hypothetical protein